MQTVLCPGDDDWFAFDVAAGTLLTARATPDGAPGLGAMTVRVPGSPDVQGAPDGLLLDDLMATVTVGAPARVLISLSHAGDGAPVAVVLAVTAEATEDAGELACATAPEMIPGEPRPLAAVLPVDRLDVSCRDLDGADHVAWFDLQGPARVSLQVLDARRETALELRPDACQGGAPAAACAYADGDVALEDLDLAQGRWFVVVEGGDAMQPEVLLTVRRRCDGDAECAPGICGGGLCQNLCAEDEDCPGAQTCDAGRCIEPALCAGDRDCVGLRVCELGECFMPECREHGDCVADGEICLDRRCGAGEVGCKADPDCPATLLCLPPGGVAAPEPCDAHADCGGPTPFCFVEAGRCVGCLADADCLPSEACFEERCTDAGGCDADADCRGSQTCGEGLCVPGACEGDRFDDAPEPPTLEGRTYSGLLLCDGQLDVYAVEVLPAQGLSVVLRHAPDQGDLYLSLVRSGELQPLATSDGPHGFEVVGVDDDDLEARVLEVQVGGRPGVSVPYSLSVLRTAGTCGPDPLEGLPNNDDQDQATRVVPGDLSTMLCPCDVDWLDPELPVGAVLTATATPLAPGPEALTLELVGPNGLLDDGEVQGDSLVAGATVVEPGRHLVRLAAADAQDRVPVDLSLEAAAAEDADVLACGVPVELVRGEAQRLPTHAPVLRFDMECAMGAALLGVDFVAHFSLDQAADVTIRASGALIAEIREQCPDGDFLWCDEPQDGVAVEDFPLEAGEYWIVLQATPGVSPEVSVDY